jgi:uncharacterized damage-inducible protein DinB
VAVLLAVASSSDPVGIMPIMTTDRPMPPLNADERTTLESWLDFYRATLAIKCEGLTEEQLRAASVRPSPLTLLGLLQHMAEVERNWFRRVLVGDNAPPIYDPNADPNSSDGGFDLSDEIRLDTARRRWEAEIDHARANCADRRLDQTSSFLGGQVTLRWIYIHMIGEYARHNGHADLLRERIDGTTGV